MRTPADIRKIIQKDSTMSLLQVAKTVLLPYLPYTFARGFDNLLTKERWEEAGCPRSQSEDDLRNAICQAWQHAMAMCIKHKPLQIEMAVGHVMWLMWLNRQEDKIVWKDAGPFGAKALHQVGSLYGFNYREEVTKEEYDNFMQMAGGKFCAKCLEMQEADSARKAKLKEKGYL